MLSCHSEWKYIEQSWLYRTCTDQMICLKQTVGLLANVHDISAKLIKNRPTSSVRVTRSAIGRAVFWRPSSETVTDSGGATTMPVSLDMFVIHVKWVSSASQLTLAKRIVGLMKTFIIVLCTKWALHTGCLIHRCGVEWQCDSGWIYTRPTYGLPSIGRPSEFYVV